MLRSVPDHHPTICAHCRNDIGVLWLIASFIDLSFMIYLLNDGDFGVLLRDFLRGTASISTNLFLLFIVVCGIRLDGVGELDMCNLKVVRGAVGVSTDEKAMRRIIFAWHTI